MSKHTNLPKMNDSVTTTAPFFSSWSIVSIFRTVLFHTSIILLFYVGYSLTSLSVCLLSFIIRMFAIAGGYHRYFSHRSYNISRVFQFILAFLGTTTGQKGPLSWATSHMKHHCSSDKAGDPHSPKLQSIGYAHLGWLWRQNALPTDRKFVQRFQQYPEIVFLNRFHTIGPVTLICFLALLGYLLDQSYPELNTSRGQLIAWGFIVPTLLILHGTCLINSVSHYCGSQRFRDGDESRNVWWLFPIALGENWHNNHHHRPSSANTSCVWWEIDVVYYIICLLEAAGLIWDVRRK